MNANSWWRRRLRWLADAGLPEHRCEAFDIEPGVLSFRGETGLPPFGYPIEVGEPITIDLPELRDPGPCRVAFRDCLPPGCSLRKDAAIEVCTEWLRGCSCAPTGRPWECEACTEAFHSRVSHLLGSEAP